MKKQVWIIVSIILIIAFCLRVYELDKESIWSDESVTIKDISQSKFSDLIKTVREAEEKPPFYHLTIHYWSNIFGTSESSLRFFSAIFGFLSVIIIFILAKELFNYKVALISTAIIAISPVQIFYSQEARSYALFAFFTLCSFLFFAKLLKKPSLKNCYLYIFFTLLSMYTNYFTIFSIILQNIIFFFIPTRKQAKKKLQVKKWMINQISVIVLSIPAFVLLIIQFSESISNIGYFYAKLNISQSAFVGIFVFLIILFIVVLKKIKKIRFNQTVFILFLIVFYAVYLSNIKILITHFFLTRYTFFMLPFFYIFIAKGITMVKPKKLMLMILIIVLLAYCFCLPIYYNTTKKEQWRETAKFIEENSGKNDIILFDARFTQRAFDYYYKGDLEKIGLPANKAEENINFFIELDESELSGKGVWLILSHNHKNKDLYEKLLDSSNNLILQKEYKGIKIYYYR